MIKGDYGCIVAQRVLLAACVVVATAAIFAWLMLRDTPARQGWQRRYLVFWQLCNFIRMLFFKLKGILIYVWDGFNESHYDEIKHFFSLMQQKPTSYLKTWVVIWLSETFQKYLSRLKKIYSFVSALRPSFANTVCCFILVFVNDIKISSYNVHR